MNGCIGNQVKIQNNNFRTSFGLNSIKCFRCTHICAECLQKLLCLVSACMCKTASKLVNKSSQHFITRNNGKTDKYDKTFYMNTHKMCMHLWSQWYYFVTQKNKGKSLQHLDCPEKWFLLFFSYSAPLIYDSGLHAPLLLHIHNSPYSSECHNQPVNLLSRYEKL